MIQSLQMVENYDEELVYQAICKSMETLSVAEDLKPDLKVVIKPNLIIAKGPDIPATTHPSVVKAVVRWLKEHGISDITIAESSGGPYNAEYMKHIYRVCGMESVAPDAKLNMDFSFDYSYCRGRLHYQYLQIENPRHDRIFRRHQESVWHNSRVGKTPDALSLA